MGDNAIIFVINLLFLRKLQTINMRMSISPKVAIAWILCPLLLIVGFSACENIHPNSENREDMATDFALVTTELTSVLEFADEVSDQTTGKGTPLGFQLQYFSKETHVVILDSTYYDGDGIEILLDFGPSVLPLKSTQKCIDGRFRGGKLKLLLESHYIENSAKSHILAVDDEPYIFGTESQTFTIDKLEIDVERKLRELLSFNVKKIELSNKSFELDAGITIEKITGINTQGIFGDHYLVKGEGHAEMNDEEFHWTINAPLLKKLEPGCGMIPVKGLINLGSEKSKDQTVIDFDPFNNESCDRIIRITNAGIATDVVLD